MSGARLACLAIACLAPTARPALAQVADEPTSLFPSWSEQVATFETRSTFQRPQFMDATSIRLAFLGSTSLRRGPVRAESFLPPTGGFPKRDAGCKAAGAVGFALGTVADMVWSDPIGRLFDDMPISRIQSPLGTRGLDDLGAIAGKALVCPDVAVLSRR